MEMVDLFHQLELVLVEFYEPEGVSHFHVYGVSHVYLNSFRLLSHLWKYFMEKMTINGFWFQNVSKNSNFACLPYIFPGGGRGEDL